MSAVVRMGVGGSDDDLALVEFEDGTTLMIGQTDRLDAGYYVTPTPNSIDLRNEQVWERKD